MDSKNVPALDLLEGELDRIFHRGTRGLRFLLNRRARAGGGSHFDPSVVEAFLTLMEGPDLLNGETRDAIRSA
jgi:hypothetical protein